MSPSARNPADWALERESGHLDIWLSGESRCTRLTQMPNYSLQVFALVTGKVLFTDQPKPEYGLDDTEAHLWEMEVFGGECFSAEQSKISAFAPAHFTADCAYTF